MIQRDFAYSGETRASKSAGLNDWEPCWISVIQRGSIYFQGTTSPEG